MSSGHYCDDCHQNYLHCTCRRAPLSERLKGSYTVQEQEAAERIEQLETQLKLIRCLCADDPDIKTILHIRKLVGEVI